MAHVKICGLTSLEDVAAVNAARPDYAGFVFALGRHQVTPAQAAQLKSRLSPGILAVGVFVNAPILEMAALANSQTIDLIQLHGDETDDMILRLKRQTTAPVIKAVRVQTEQDILQSLSSPAEYLLFDTFVKDAYGGSGHTFDWAMIPILHRPYFLAGGLNQENICRAARTPACCLDISSGAETDGKKDPDKVKRIVRTVRDIPYM